MSQRSNLAQRQWSMYHFRRLLMPTEATVENNIFGIFTAKFADRILHSIFNPHSTKRGRKPKDNAMLASESYTRFVAFCMVDFSCFRSSPDGLIK